jgi:hypothetical protein
LKQSETTAKSWLAFGSQSKRQNVMLIWESSTTYLNQSLNLKSYGNILKNAKENGMIKAIPKQTSFSLKMKEIDFTSEIGFPVEMTNKALANMFNEIQEQN